MTPIQQRHARQRVRNDNYVNVPVTTSGLERPERCSSAPARLPPAVQWPMATVLPEAAVVCSVAAFSIRVTSSAR